MDNSIVYSEGIGTVTTINGQLGRDVEFTRVLHVPALHSNLLAVLYLTLHKGFDIQISCDSLKFSLNNQLCFTGLVRGSTGYLNGSTVENIESVHIALTLPLNLSLWHKWLGHHNYDDIKQMNKLRIVCYALHLGGLSIWMYLKILREGSCVMSWSLFALDHLQIALRKSDLLSFTSMCQYRSTCCAMRGCYAIAEAQRKSSLSSLE